MVCHYRARDALGVLIVWLPLTKVKRQKLEEIQAKIEHLDKEHDIANKGTLETINRLIDYHERIRKTRNSAIDVGVVLRFLQSLLLPLIASLLASINDLIHVFSP
jgi:hypothetical protein